MTQNSVAAAQLVDPATTDCLDSTFFGHVIGGEVVPSISGATMSVVDPSTGLEVATAAAGDAADADRAVRSAREAFDDGRWRLLPPMEKERRLHRLADLVEERRVVVGDLDAVDSGLLRSYTTFLEQFAIDSTRYAAGWPSKIHGSVPPVPHGLSVQSQRVPRGVVGLITPWNGPAAVLSFVAAALAAGNSLVLKPAENTPMTAVLLAQLAAEAGIPEGVFNVLQGAGESVGAALVNHPDVALISFTGSVETGRAIQAASANTLKAVSLELGGKSPFIVFDDADLELASATATGSVWSGQGQVCTAGSRVLVQRGIHDEFVAAMIEKSRDVRLGATLDPTATMGPLVSAEQLARVKSYVEIGQREGAELALACSEHDGPGFFHGPVIFTGVRNDMRIAQEEIFGPVMSVIPFDDESDALRIANDTDYGLAAGVFTRDLSRSQRVSAGLDVGTVWINCYQMVYPSVTYGGVKQSGNGRVLGEEMMHELTQVKNVWVAG